MLMSITTDDEVSVSQVGGKAASLVRLHQAGFDVPDGFVLTTRFFADWIDTIEDSHQWSSAMALMEAIGQRSPDLKTRARLAEACDQVKQMAGQFQWSEQQRDVLNQLASLGPGPFAVRSSSPEEDLAGASFAGQYETLLDVGIEGMPAAVHTCFVSCLDSRVLLYKHMMQFDSLTPAIAVVVQHLIASETSGVAFSINPLTNDYDELLINASWGLGESLVSGDITPDAVVINKVTGDAADLRVGDKGGDRASEFCLTEAEYRKICAVATRVEAVYAAPVDVEWAFTSGRLHILQARPITTHIPLAEQLLTPPGAPRHLYFDGYLTDGITMSGPITPVSNDLMRKLLEMMLAWAIAPVEQRQLGRYGMMISAGRMYYDMSLWLHTIGSGKRLKQQVQQMDPTMAAVFTSPGLDQYRLKEIPGHLRLVKLIPQAPRILWRVRRAILVLLRPMRKPDEFRSEYQHLVAGFEPWVRRPIEFDRPVAEVFHDDMVHAGTVTMDSTYPAFMQFYFATLRLKGLVDDQEPEQMRLMSDLLGGYEQDMVVQMGHRIFDLAQLLDASEFGDLTALERRIEKRELPEAFLRPWDEFMSQYGHRGPLEMDIVNPRYGDAPRLVLQQIASLAESGGGFNPHDMLATKIRAREAAYDELLALLPRRKAKKLKKWYPTTLLYAGTREYFKHHLTHLYHRTRKHLLHRARAFVAAGRMDSVNDIFQLTLDDVDRAHGNADLNIRAMVDERGALFRQQKRQVRHFPLVIDSRGRLFRSSPGQTDLPAGSVAGAPVSPGVATGPIKVLNDPFEKEVEPGDVLVAVTTDPGWTPLFINAAAIILEVGGELQHGALVAREYGKPCVSGISDVTNAFSDGQMVEVDGTTGIVRVL